MLLSLLREILDQAGTLYGAEKLIVNCFSQYNRKVCLTHCSFRNGFYFNRRKNQITEKEDVFGRSTNCTDDRFRAIS